MRSNKKYNSGPVLSIQMINHIFHQRSPKWDLIKFLLNGARCVSGEKTITLMTAWEERPVARGIWQRRAKSVGGLGNEGMIFCPVIATVPVTQLDLIGWFCVRCWCGGGGGCDSAGREFARFICLTAFIFWRARSKKATARSLGLQLRSPSGAEETAVDLFLFSHATHALHHRPTARPSSQKYPFCVWVCVRGAVESSPELKWAAPLNPRPPIDLGASAKIKQIEEKQLGAAVKQPRVGSPESAGPTHFFTWPASFSKEPSMRFL